MEKNGVIKWKKNNMYVKSAGIPTMFLTRCRRLAGTFQKYLIFKTRNLRLSAVPDAATQNCIGSKAVMVGIFWTSSWEDANRKKDMPEGDSFMAYLFCQPDFVSPTFIGPLAMAL